MKLSTLFQRCMNIPYIHVENGADYAVERIGTVLYLYFSHSDGATDWKNNLSFPAKPYRRMGKTVWFAHRGFLGVWESIKPYVSGDIADPAIRKIVSVGYSHGAAVAALCHEYAWFHRPDLREVSEGYGFGCPRVLWGLDGAALRERWANFLVIRNIDDVVTHLPPALLGFSHVGTMLTIGEKGNYSAIDAHRPENILTELLRREGERVHSSISKTRT